MKTITLIVNTILEINHQRFNRVPVHVEKSIN